MQKGIIGKKLGMTQLFDANGKVVPVTIIEAGPCTVVQKKTVESDGYQAVQMGYGEVSAKKVNKATRALSSASASIACARATAPAPLHVMPVLTVPLPPRPACSRASVCPATWALCA